MKNPLDTASDELRELLHRAEDHFRKMKASVTAQVRIDEETVLSFEKREKDWILCFRVTHKGKERFTPLQTASRRLRVLTAMKLNEMREAILDAQSANLEEVESAISCAKEFLEQYEKS